VSPDQTSFIVNSARKAADRRIKCVLYALQAQPGLRAAQLAPRVGLTASYLQKLFKKEIGFRIGEYAMELRLLRASHLLAETLKPLKEIRHEVGIPDPSNFARWFKERFGCAPMTFRKRADARLNQQIGV